MAWKWRVLGRMAIRNLIWAGNALEFAARAEIGETAASDSRAAAQLAIGFSRCRMDEQKGAARQRMLEQGRFRCCSCAT